MKKPVALYLIVLLLVSVNGISKPLPDIQDDISNYIKAGNTKEIARYFAANVSMAILTDEGSYPKAQAEAKLKEFFSRHAPVSIKPLHKLSSNPNHKFTVLLLRTSSGDFRVSFSLKATSTEFQLTEIRIEDNKE